MDLYFIWRYYLRFDTYIGESLFNPNFLVVFSIGSILTLSMLYNHTMAAWTDPGYAGDYKPDDLEEEFQQFERCK